MQSGRNQQALDLLEEMAREHPGKQTLHSRLADAYRAAGRTMDAIAQYDALGEIQLDAGQAEAATRTIKTILSLDPPDSEGYQGTAAQPGSRPLTARLRRNSPCPT